MLFSALGNAFQLLTGTATLVGGVIPIGIAGLLNGFGIGL